MRLQGKTALVTGATSGIGAAIAQAFAREGARVVLTGRHAERGQAIAQTIRQAGGEAHVVVADLTSNQGIGHLVAQTQQAVGPLDILVNNAGIFPMAETAQIDEATFDAVIATNFKAPFFLVAAFAPQMAGRGSGKIMNITTVLAHKGFAGASLYGATKAALTLLTRSWAAEFGPRGINVNAIAPHLVRTPGIGGTARSSIKWPERFRPEEPPRLLRLPPPLSTLPAPTPTLFMASPYPLMGDIWPPNSFVHGAVHILTASHFDTQMTHSLQGRDSSARVIPNLGNQ